MDKQFHNIVVDELQRNTSRLDTYNETLVRLTVTVEEHVRRTNLLEQKIKPIEQHVQFINTFAKFMAAGATFLVALRSLHVI